MTVLGNHFTDVTEALLKFQERGFLCDAILVAKCGGELKAHAVLLAAASSVFMSALEAVPSGGPHHLYFPEIEFDVLQIAVHFMYTGELLLPTIYSQMDQLSLLLNKLADLGLDLYKLHGCEMTFMRKIKLSSAPKPTDSVISGVEHNYHKTNSREAMRKRRQGLGDLFLDVAPSSLSKCNKVTIIDLPPTSCPVIPLVSSGSSESSSSPALVSGTLNAGLIPECIVDEKKAVKRAISILKPLETILPKTAIAAANSNLPLYTHQLASPTNLKDLSSGSVQAELDQSMGQIFVLDADNPGFWDVVTGAGEGNSLEKQDVYHLADASAEEQSAIALELEGEGPPVDLDSSEGRTGAYVCDFCGERDRKEFKTEFELSWHKIKFHWDKCHECTVCGRKFSSESSLRSHVKRHFGIRSRQRSKNFRCDECGLHFETYKKLKGHKFRHSGEKPFECSECGKQFTTPGNLERHQMLHSGYRPFLCDFCGKGFVQKWSLMEHMSLHHEEKRDFECALCGCKLKDRDEMEKHALEIHQLSHLVELNSMIKNPETYLCDLCGKNLNSLNSLRHHIRGHGNKPARCETCGKKFSTFYGLQLHTKLHTGERPFICEVCQKGFIQKTSLITHLATHSGIKPFSCVVCSKSFTSKGQLKQHMLMHSGEKPYTCGICSKQFTYKSSLTLHNRTHTGDKPYKCTICATSYTQLHHLRGHMRTHTGEKPFSCEICKKSYKNKIDLRYHYTRFHKVDIKRITLNTRSEYVYELDHKMEEIGGSTPEENTVSSIDEFAVCEMKPDL